MLRCGGRATGTGDGGSREESWILISKSCQDVVSMRELDAPRALGEVWTPNFSCGCIRLGDGSGLRYKFTCISNIGCEERGGFIARFSNWEWEGSGLLGIAGLWGERSHSSMFWSDCVGVMTISSGSCLNVLQTHANTNKAMRPIWQANLFCSANVITLHPLCWCAIYLPISDKRCSKAHGYGYTKKPYCHRIHGEASILQKKVFAAVGIDG